MLYVSFIENVFLCTIGASGTSGNNKDFQTRPYLLARAQSSKWIITGEKTSRYKKKTMCNNY